MTAHDKQQTIQPSPQVHGEKNRVQGMVRSMDQWRGMDPKAVLAGSNAQALFALQDARNDIMALWGVLVALATATSEGSGEQVATYEEARLRRMVERRDAFIISNGLWDVFKEARRGED